MRTLADELINFKILTYFANELIANLNITDSNIQTFLRNNDEVSGDFYGYLIGNSWSTESKDFVLWGAGYLADNPNVDFDALKSKITLANLDLNDPLLVDKLLRVDLETRINFPKFSHLVDNMKKIVLANPKVMLALKEYSGMSETDILNEMEPKKGPLVKPISTLVSQVNAQAFFNPSISRTTLFINLADVEYFEAKLPSNFIPNITYDINICQAYGYLLAVTVLHEYVHYGRNANNLPRKTSDINEFGNAFERLAIGYITDYTNMQDIKLNFKIIW